MVLMATSNIQDRTSGNAVHSSTDSTALSLGFLDVLDWQLEFGGLNEEVAPCTDRGENVELDDVAQLGTASLDTLTPAERRAQSNKLAQRRARARRKARAAGTEAQLAVTSAELQALQNKQKALEARNNLLEKVVQLNQNTQRTAEQPPPAAVSVEDLQETCGFMQLPGPTAKLLASNMAVKLTVYPDQEQLVQLSDFATMPVKAMAKIFTAYIDAFRQLLDRLSQGDDEQAQQRLNSLLLELQSFIMIVPLLYPGRMKEFVSCRMDTGAACSEIPADNKPCLDDPHILAVLQHTASQKTDLLFLRRLFFGKIGQLARQRRDILQCMSNLESEPRGTGKRHDTLNELTMQLQENGREDYRTHVQLTGAMHEGIYTPQQWAAALVYQYPFIPRHKRWPELLAAQEGEPSMQELITDDSLTDAQHSANWEMIVDYLSNLTLEQKAYHVPLPR